jgi:hypothetical protein
MTLELDFPRRATEAHDTAKLFHPYTEFFYDPFSNLVISRVSEVREGEKKSLPGPGDPYPATSGALPPQTHLSS